MSDNLARALSPAQLGNTQPEWQRTPESEPRRHIEIVAPSKHARPRIVYALSAVTCVGAIVVAQLLLSVGISQGAYEISALRTSQVELSRTADSVSEDLIRVSSPQSLAANAESLGMVTNSNSAYLRLSDGAVLGAPSSATAGQAGAAGLVPNALLNSAPVASQTPAGGQGAGVASGAAAAAAGTVGVASVAVADGLPSPTTR